MNDEYYMSLAIEEAKKAAGVNEVTVGAVIVYNDQVIAKCHNYKEHSNRTIAHAEILAIEKANCYFDSWYLNDCTLYVTLEPCMMCTGAIVQSRIKRVVFGAADSRWPGMSTLLNDYTYNHEVELTSGVLKEDCSSILSNYFRSKRRIC
jgi:tRNA(adenine34) deaminase